MLYSSATVNLGAYMDFKSATDALFHRVTHADLAEEMRVSIPSIRQARLDSEALAYRNPPENWEVAVRKLAEAQIKHFRHLLSQLGH